MENYEYYQQNAKFVDEAVDIIGRMPKAKCYDSHYIEKYLIPELGLNNEGLHEQPPELNAFYGTGLHLWQYPNQFAKYLAWLTFNAHDIRSYMEIGSRWGGTFIVVCEWLKKIGAPLDFAVAVDPVPLTPFIARYTEIAGFPVLYKQSLSTDPVFRTFALSVKPEMMFIDGDHTVAGVMNDHELARRFARIIVHHDVHSQSCGGTTLFWNYVKQVEEQFEAIDFIDQYQSVNGHFLGIGVLKRKTRTTPLGARADYASV